MCGSAPVALGGHALKVFVRARVCVYVCASVCSYSLTHQVVFREKSLSKLKTVFLGQSQVARGRKTHTGARETKGSSPGSRRSWLRQRVFLLWVNTRAGHVYMIIYNCDIIQSLWLIVLKCAYSPPCIFMRACVCVCAFAYLLYTCMCVLVYGSVCMFEDECVCLWMNVCVCVYLWKCVRVSMWICAFVCVIDEDRLRESKGDGRKRNREGESEITITSQSFMCLFATNKSFLSSVDGT